MEIKIYISVKLSKLITLGILQAPHAESNLMQEQLSQSQVYVISRNAGL